MEESKYQERELFLAVFSFFKKNILLLALLGLLGGGLGYGYSKMGGPSYTYSSELCSEVIEGELIAKSMLSLSDIVSGRQTKTTSKILGLTAEQAKSILSLSFEYSDELAKRSYEKDNLSFGSNCIKMKVLFSDTTHIVTSIRAIQNYVLNNQTFVRMQKNIMNSNIELLEKLKLKSSELDQLHKVMLHNPSAFEMNDIGYTSSLHIEREKVYLKQKIERFSQVGFFSNDGSEIKTIRKKSVSFMLAGLVSLMFLGLTVLLLREINRLL